MAHRAARTTMRAMRLFAGRPRWARILLTVALAGLALLVLAQALPYGRSHTNPPVTKEPAWNAPQTRELALRACGDCHSNLTVWRWYSNVAPVSWLVQADVDGGRGALNLSEWDKPQDTSPADVADAIRGGSMPPWVYTIVHGSSKLSAAEKQQLIDGLAATFAASPPLGGGGG